MITIPNSLDMARIFFITKSTNLEKEKIFKNDDSKIWVSYKQMITESFFLIQNDKKISNRDKLMKIQKLDTYEVLISWEWNAP